MRSRSVVYLVPLLLAAAATAVSAQFFSTYVTSMEFAGNRPPEGVTWSSSIGVTDRGLSTPAAPPNTSHDFWIQLQPLAAGVSWRPPRSTDVKVSVTGLALDNGHIRLFLRYSSDLAHWSSWYHMQTTATGAEYRASVSLPGAASEKYDRLMQEWWRSAPQWSSDEHEFCVWLATQHPDYFATEVPFIGYVQVRLEGNARQFRLAAVKVEQSWGVSGLSSIPKGTRRASADDKWFFDLNRFLR